MLALAGGDRRRHARCATRGAIAVVGVKMARHYGAEAGGDIAREASGVEARAPLQPDRQTASKNA